MRDCELCRVPGGDLVWQDQDCRLVRVAGAEGDAFPGYCRVIWHDHVADMTDLPDLSRNRLMRVVLATEAAVRRLVAPDKVNLAALGNMVPHLHWHVIPRWRDDSHFPAPIWTAPVRPVRTRSMPTIEDLREAFVKAFGESGEVR